MFQGCEYTICGSTSFNAYSFFNMNWDHMKASAANSEESDINKPVMLIIKQGLDNLVPRIDMGTAAGPAAIEDLPKRVIPPRRTRNIF